MAANRVQLGGVNLRVIPDLEQGHALRVNLQNGLVDDASIDAFGRQRVSEPFTLFDSQMHYNDLPLYWESQLTGAGTATHIPNSAAVQMSCGTASGDKVVRQTKRYFQYQPGKSQRTLLTFVMGAAKANVRQRVGYFDTLNGIFLELTGSGLGIVRRSNVTGTPVDTRVEQADWNVDVMDGSGPSNVTLDIAKAQILLMDFEWLGVGRVRCGFVIDGKIYYFHEFLHANNIDVVYMSTANLPIRYEIENTGAAASGTSLMQICAEVSSEGGVQERNLTFGHTMTTSRSVTDTPLPILSIQVGTAFPSGGTILNRETVQALNFSIYTEDAAIAYWIVYNGTIAGASWQAVNATHSGVNYDVSGTALTGGVIVDAGGYLPATNQAKLSAAGAIESDLFLTNNVAGNSGDRLTIMAQRLTATDSDTWAAITWKELY